MWGVACLREMERLSGVILLTLCLLLSHVTSTLHDYPPTFSISGAKKQMFHDSADGGLHYFRYLHVNGDVVYVGAMEHIYRLNADNINQTDRQYRKSNPLPARLADKDLCDPKQENSDFECRNHIRSMVFENNQIHACGTGAYFPMYFTLNSYLEPIEVYPPEDRNTGIMRCPYGPSDPYTLYMWNGEIQEAYHQHIQGLF